MYVSSKLSFTLSLLVVKGIFLGKNSKNPYDYFFANIHDYKWPKNVSDEISMLSRRLFEQIEYIFRHIRANNNPFGGVQVRYQHVKILQV
jgi:hypothetical protein